MKTEGASFLEKLLFLLFPPKCPVCGVFLDAPTVLCSDCLKKWKTEKARLCQSCAYPAEDCKCPPAKLDTVKLAGRQIVTLAFYTPEQSGNTVTRLVFALKNNEDRSICRLLGGELSELIKKTFAEANENITDWHITFSPRTKKSVTDYGFDHAKELTKIISEKTGAKYENVFKRQGGEEQKYLGKKQRKKNVEISLFLKNKAVASGKKYILIDDVVTTGATVNRCAKLLTEAGSAAVFVASVTKKMPEKSKTKLWFE